jgi:hypothetical protein
MPLQEALGGTPQKRADFAYFQVQSPEKVLNQGVY